MALLEDVTVNKVQGYNSAFTKGLFKVKEVVFDANPISSGSVPSGFGADPVCLVLILHVWLRHDEF